MVDAGMVKAGMVEAGMVEVGVLEVGMVEVGCSEPVARCRSATSNCAACRSGREQGPRSPAAG
jgi:hypothetical protein